MQRLRSCHIGIRPILPLMRLPHFHHSATQAIPARPLLRTRPFRYLSTTSQNDVRKTPSSNKDDIVAPSVPTSILDRLPGFAKPLKPYLELTRIDKPIGTLLLYWPCAWSITMASTANHLPVTMPLFYLALFGTGAIIMRGAGCTINDMWDSKIDKAVDRTRNRPIARGDVSQFQALTFLGVQLSAGLAILTQLNWYSILLGASSLSLVVVYPLMKRITYYPQFVLGLAFNWGALLGWSAVAGSVDWSVAGPLYAGGIAWCVLYDTIYAHQDKKDDILVNVKSTALRFGDHSRTVLSGLGTAFVSLLTYAGYASGAGPLYYLISCMGAASHLTWQLRTVNFDDRKDCWDKFVSNGRLGGLVWVGMFADYVAQMSGWMW
ncbi:hypothetical protein NliqN6_0740 [Naganishia liquefaciens]|uniref:4-hydroxybenzoate polyprenyltransferase, mitochondrial n=1 Tax=Naganishia liquefaciens TaxID=104408 RepID=A0A8H3YCM5_9TREE|nr:hypothetical protein NliqN6_0740 [Naganishia liquefaciens]